MIQNYCADMRSLVKCKQEQKNTRVDQLDVQFNVWQIKTSIFSFVCDMTSEPQKSNLPIQVGPNCDPHREEKEKKMQANYKKLMNFYRNRIVPTYKEIDEYTDDFKKIYDKFVAPYENKDDEYASKMGKSAVAFIPDGAFAGGKFVKSISELKATKSESEIAELEKPKVKEVKPKDVEGEKPKVSKVEEKPIGPQAKLEKVKFKEGRYEHHMSYVEKFTKKGVSGGHNWKKFDDYIGKSEYSFDYHKVIKHPDIDGVYEIEYTLKRPIKDYTGKPIPGEFKHVPGGNRIFKKTVYDPNVISDNEMIKLSKDAMKEAVKENRFVSRPNQNKRLLQGQVSYKGKILKFEGFKNMNTGEIENAYPVLEWSAQNE